VVLALVRRLNFLSFKHRELGWCQCAEAAVRPQVVVVVPPPLDNRTRLGQAGEHVLVEALVAQLAVE